MPYQCNAQQIVKICCQASKFLGTWLAYSTNYKNNSNENSRRLNNSYENNRHLNNSNENSRLFTFLLNLTLLLIARIKSNFSIIVIVVSTALPKVRKSFSFEAILAKIWWNSCRKFLNFKHWMYYAFNICRNRANVF